VLKIIDSCSYAFVDLCSFAFVDLCVLSQRFLEDDDEDEEGAEGQGGDSSSTAVDKDVTKAAVKQ